MIDRETRCIVSWDLVTQRTEATLQPLLDALWQQSPHPGAPRCFYSDGFPVYPTLVYRHGQQQSLPDKSQTYSVEGVNADLRCYISSLVRRTRGFARQRASLRRRIWLFVYCYNRRRLAVQRAWARRWPALAATYQAAPAKIIAQQRRRLRQCLLYRFPLIHFLPALF